jgi:hypothetical protein
MTAQADVKRYLLANYEIAESDVDATLSLDSSQEIIRSGERLGSFPYYVGDRIAEAQGWQPLPEPEEGEDRYDGTPEQDD